MYKGTYSIRASEKLKTIRKHALYLGVYYFKNPYWINSMAIGKIYRWLLKQITGSDMFYRLESKKRVGAIHTIGVLSN